MSHFRNRKGLWNRTRPHTSSHSTYTLCILRARIQHKLKWRNSTLPCAYSDMQIERTLKAQPNTNSLICRLLWFSRVYNSSRLKNISNYDSNNNVFSISSYPELCPGGLNLQPLVLQAKAPPRSYTHPLAISPMPTF